MPPHAVPHVSNRQSLPQTDNLDLQRVVVKTSKAEGLVNRANHHEFDDEQSKMQVNKEIDKCVCCEGRCNTHCPYEKIQESLRKNTQREILKNLTVKWVTS